MRQAKHRSANNATFSILTLAGLLAGCANLQAPVSQFGQAMTATTNAEQSYFDPIYQRMADVENLCLMSSRAVDIKNGQIVSTETRCQPNSNPGDVRTAINAVLSPVQAYATALQALANDTAGTTFSTNTATVGTNLQTFDSKVLTPLGAKGLPGQTQINAVSKAVQDIGSALITFAANKDVKEAAGKVSQPLTDIATAMKNINAYWSGQLPAQLTNQVGYYIIDVWRTGTYSDRQALAAIWAKDGPTVSPVAANSAWDKLVAANTAIAAAGPALSMAQIQAAAQAANDALAAYKALGGK